MAFDEHLAERVRSEFRRKKVKFEEKKMMGGLCFMVNDKMCAGVEKNRLMARVGREGYADAMKHKGCREMKITGKVLTGFVLIEPEAIDMDEDLAYWIEVCLAYNPFAKSSKK